MSRTDKSLAIIALRTDKASFFFGKSSQQLFGFEGQFDLARLANQVFQIEKPSVDNDVAIEGEYDTVAAEGSTYEFARRYQRRNVATIKQVFGDHYNLGVKESTVAPPSVPVGVNIEGAEQQVNQSTSDQVAAASTGVSTGNPGISATASGKQQTSTTGFNTGGDQISGTPFDYRARANALPAAGKEGEIKTKRIKEGTKVGNIDRPGHKRDVVVKYQKETKNVRAFDGR